MRPSQPPRPAARPRPDPPGDRRRRRRGQAAPGREPGGARGAPRRAPSPRRGPAPVTVSRSRRRRAPRMSARRSSTRRSASARADATASSRSRRARRRSSSATFCASAARCSATRARSSASRAARSAARIDASVSSNACWPSVRRDRASATIGRGQAEAFGDREGLAAARQADPEVVRRRERLEVELDRRVADLRRRVGVDLELGVVGRRGHQRAGAQEVVEERLGERRPLGRDRSRRRARRAGRAWPGRRPRRSGRSSEGGPENVERDWATDCSSPMSAKTSRRTGRRLPGSAGTWRPAWCISTSRPIVRSVTVLPPVFGPGDDERPEVGAELHVDRDDPPGQARVAGALEADLGPRGRLGADGVHLLGQARLGAPQVEPGQRVEQSRGGARPGSRRAPTARRGSARSRRPRRAAPRARRCPARRPRAAPRRGSGRCPRRRGRSP